MRCAGRLPYIIFLIVSACSPSEEQVKASRVAPAGVVSAVEFVAAADEAGEAPARVRLAGVQPPAPGALAGAAEARLGALLSRDGGVRLTRTGPGEDRYGRVIAHVEIGEGEDAVWIQGAMVAEGLLAAASYADTRERAAELLALEADARAAGRGGWGSGDFEVLDPDPNRLAQRLDSRVIVEGRVIDVSPPIRGRVYVNFGLDWRTDFTAAIPGDALALFEETGLDPSRLEGARVRVRGWLYEENGPMVRIDHPEAIELVDAPEGMRRPGG